MKQVTQPATPETPMTFPKQFLALTLTTGIMACGEPTRPIISGPSGLAAAASGATDLSARPMSKNISGHIAGQIIGANPLCDGALTEIGTFTGAPGGTFVACVTDQRQDGNGALVFDLTHIYKAENGDTFTTTDHVVAAPINPPIYRINNHATITGGTGMYEGASGFIEDHGTLNLATGVVSVDYHGRISTP
jgi:hypothetical protein